jgi:DNA-binding NarL/FixJ family response regulator
LCVDDDALLLTALSQVIDLEEDMRCVGCLASADGLADQVAATEADVILLDLTMPGRAPLDALTEVSRRFPGVATLICSGHHDTESIGRAMAAGAAGYVAKNGNIEQVLQAVRQSAIMAKRAHMP